MFDPPYLPLELQYDYGGRCWWCGDLADSREHKWKRTDVVRMFGAGPYRGDISWGRGDNRRNPQGANSSEFKFAANLCRRCNNERSQPFDRAYDTWASWVSANLEWLQQAGHVVLADAFPLDAEARIENLARYFVKHIGCRLADAGVEVPEDFVVYLGGGTSRPSSLRAGLGIRLDLLALNDELRREGIYETPGLWMRPLLSWYSPSAGAVVEVWSGLSIGPFEFWFWLRLRGLAEPEFADCLEFPVVPLFRYHGDGPVDQAALSLRPGE